jgi:hypothetical protein
MPVSSRIRTLRASRARRLWSRRQRAAATAPVSARPASRHRVLADWPKVPCPAPGLRGFEGAGYRRHGGGGARPGKPREAVGQLPVQIPRHGDGLIGRQAAT